MAVRPIAGTRKLVVIEDGLLSSLANNADFLREFPVLQAIRNYAPKPGGCGGCGAANTQKAKVFSDVKRQLAGMPDDRRRKLKELLNAQKVQIRYKTGSKVVNHEF